jgi:hypothetical protein
MRCFVVKNCRFSAPPVRRKTKSPLTAGFLFRNFSLFIGGQGQNRTADTGIFRVCKINNLLIILE